MARERNQRSLWQVLGIYAAASWVCLQIVDVLTQNMGLPPWVFTLTLGMLITGLPVTAATAYFQGLGKTQGSGSTHRHRAVHLEEPEKSSDRCPRHLGSCGDRLGHSDRQGQCKL